jgi:putative spermidine/putrescine transport system ATP-binding protein
MRQEIRRIHEQLGSTTIYVTHDQDEALSLADRIVVMRDGGVRQVGTPEDLYARPAHLDVAEFMGFRNRLPGRLIELNGDRARVEVAGTVLDGTARVPLAADAVVVAIRPDDLAPVAENGIPATVAAAEYRGREFYGTATTADGLEIGFTAHDRPTPGDPIRLATPPDRVLVFAVGPTP